MTLWPNGREITMPKKITFTIESLRELGGNKYNHKFTYLFFNNEIGSKDQFKYICPIHGEQVSQPRYHLDPTKHTGCIKCGRVLAVKNATKREDIFKEQATKYHEGKYDYSKFVYSGNKVHGNVRCTTCEHEWKVRPDLHLSAKSKQGCPSCKLNAIYTKDYYEKHFIEDHECSLYIVKFTERVTKESFVKVGITKHSNIKTRFRGLHSKYIIEVLYQKDSMFFEVYKLEQQLHSLSKNYKYKPIDKFKGYTECFTIEVLDILQSSLGAILEVNSP